jgi:hypothetical protein
MRDSRLSFKLADAGFVVASCCFMPGLRHACRALPEIASLGKSPFGNPTSERTIKPSGLRPRRLVGKVATDPANTGRETGRSPSGPENADVAPHVAHVRAGGDGSGRLATTVAS